MGNAIDILKQPITHEWITPQSFYDSLHAEFRFTVDAAADETNHKCERWFGIGGEALSGLAVPWVGEVVWCNPPYGRYIGDWVQKSHDEARSGATVVMLIPARTETAYWHNYAMRANEIRFVCGRLNFGGDRVIGHNAPFPSAVVVFRPAWCGTPTIRSIGRDGR